MVGTRTAGYSGMLSRYSPMLRSYGIYFWDLGDEWSRRVRGINSEHRCDTNSVRADSRIDTDNLS